MSHLKHRISWTNLLASFCLCWSWEREFPLEVAAGTLEVIPAELCRDSLEILYGLFLSDSAPDYSEMGSPRTNKCISTDQAQEKGLDKCLISAQRPG